MNNTLYLKYRPQKFSELVAQEHISKVLASQVKLKEFSHAYIFSGPRGCGKTSTARIFAKALNCLNNLEGEPCGNCENCKQIDQNKAVDIIEIDAASNRSIDDIRSFRELVKFHPVTFPYKVFIIDEVHMLTKEAFNALLKTLEEPPEYVVFILCTTDLHKVPVTILSRCQQFHFRLASNEELKTKLALICKSENLEIEDNALDLVVEAGAGSFRDAESLLQKLLSNSESRKGSIISYSETVKILGIGDNLKITKYFAEFFTDSFEVNLQNLDQLLSEFSVEQLLSASIKYFRQENKLFTRDLRFKIYELLLELKSKTRSSQNIKDWLELYFWKIYNLGNGNELEKGSGESKDLKVHQTDEFDTESQFKTEIANTNLTAQNLTSASLEDVEIKVIEGNTATKDRESELQRTVVGNIEVVQETQNIINITSKWNELCLKIKEEDIRLAGYLQGARIVRLESNALYIAVKSKLAKSVLEIKRNSDKIANAIQKLTAKNFELYITVDKKEENEINPVEFFGAVIA